MASGEQPAEWVFTAAAGERMGSVEILEHGLQRARDQFEERKLKHLAALLAYLFYEDQFGPADAHRFLELGGRLSYRQLLLLSIFADDEIRAELPGQLLSPGMSWTMMGLLLEIQQLAVERAIVTDGHLVSSYHEVNLAHTKSLVLGSVLHSGMRLKEVDAEARAAVVDDLTLSFRVPPAASESP
jgi:hypothetical protein